MGEKFFQNVGCPDFQAGCVDAWVAADKFMSLDNLLVYEKLNLVFPVIHKAKNTDGTRSDIKKFLHVFRLGKGQAGTADLAGKNRGFEFFLAGHHQQIESGSLCIAEK